MICSCTQASLLGGSYVASSLTTFSGKLSIPLKGGIQLKLDMSKVFAKINFFCFYYIHICRFTVNRIFFPFCSPYVFYASPSNVQKADRKFIECLLSLIRNIQRAIQLHQDLSGNTHNPAELMTGSFNGIKVVLLLLPNLFLNFMSNVVPVRSVLVM